MTISNDFQKSVLFAFEERGVKAQRIITELERILDWGIQSHQKSPVNNRAADFYRKKNVDNLDESKFLQYEAFDQRDQEISTRIDILVNTSGKISIDFIGFEYSALNGPKAELVEAIAKINETDPQYDDRKTYSFDFDDYKAEEAVAKILTLIQHEDPSDFGPLVAETMHRMKASLKDTHVPKPGAPA